jgi:DNA-binding GntR family transcriptional regulator
VIAMTERDGGPRFDPRGPHLVYMLIADDIAAQIERGELTPGQRLPGEADLASHYGAARMTIRRAIRELRERGLVKVLSGKGTFVLPENERPRQA